MTVTTDRCVVFDLDGVLVMSEHLWEQGWQSVAADHGYTWLPDDTKTCQGKSVPEWAREFDATTWPQFFLKFLLGHDAVTAVIPGTTNPAHLADNISAGRGRFPDAGQRQAMVKFFDTL